MKSPPLRELPEYPVGANVVISLNGVYREAEVIEWEKCWNERTKEREARVKLGDGRKLRIAKEQIIQLKQP